MKKKALLLLTALVMLLLLCSCSLFKKKGPDVPGTAESTENTGNPGASDPTDPDTDAHDDPVMERIEQAANGELDLDSLSIDELVEYCQKLGSDDEAAALNQGADYDLYYRDADFVSDDPYAELHFETAKNVKSVSYSDDPWEEKGVEVPDITEGMSPSEKAEYEAMMQELEDFDPEAFQAEIDEMLKDMEGFEDYDPEAEEGTSEDEGYETDPGDAKILNRWPEDEFGRTLPEPDFEVSMLVEDEESLTFVTSLDDISKAKAYAEKVKAAGFTVDAEENSQSIAGITMYYYSASNGKGFSVDITFAGGSLTAVLSKS